MMLEDTIECGDIAPLLRRAMSQQRGLAVLVVVFIAGWLEVDVTTLSRTTWSSELSQVEPRANTFTIEQSPGSRGLPSIGCVPPPLVACFNELQADESARELPCLLVQDGSANGWLQYNHPFDFYDLDSLSALAKMPERSAWLLGF